jgi:hypothetical protein
VNPFGADHVAIRPPEVGRVQVERMALGAPHAAVRSDQLLEGGDLARVFGVAELDMARDWIASG